MRGESRLLAVGVLGHRAPAHRMEMFEGHFVNIVLQPVSEINLVMSKTLLCEITLVMSKTLLCVFLCLVKTRMKDDN